MYTEVYKRKWLLATGTSMLFMAILAGFSYGFVHSEIYVAGDAKQTSELLYKNHDLFKLGIISWILIVLLDIIVSIGVYKIYEKYNKNIAILTCGLRLIYTLFLGLSIVYLVEPAISKIEAPHVLLAFESFEYVWNLGLIVFGVHLFFLSINALKSTFTPKLIGFLLFLGGLSYTIIHGLKIFFPKFFEITLIIESVLILPMALSELFFSLWLIYFYFKVR